MTASVAAEEKLRETQKLESLGVLAGGVAHDFNNLLVGILGNASLARTSVEPGSELDRLLEQIELAGASAPRSSPADARLRRAEAASPRRAAT